MRKAAIIAAAAAVAVIACAASGISAASAHGFSTPLGKGWPACAPKQRQVSGYFDVNATDSKHYFFWMIEPEQNAETSPVIIWLSGGPGCSSSLATLMENGPCRFNETTGEMYKSIGWTDAGATMVWVDQPAGVGFSYSDRAGRSHDEQDEIAEPIRVDTLAGIKRRPRRRFQGAGHVLAIGPTRDTGVAQNDRGKRDG